MQYYTILSLLLSRNPPSPHNHNHNASVNKEDVRYVRHVKKRDVCKDVHPRENTLVKS